MDKIAKTIRVSTASPFIALALSTMLFLNEEIQIGGFTQYCALVLFLSILPILAYPLQPIVPYFNTKGRSGQRSLAFVTSVIGYVSGIAFAVITDAPKTVFVMYWSYFLSVLLLTLINTVTRFRASGHACGVAGPIASMIYFIGPQTAPALLVFAAMCWASLKMKRHTPAELVLGSVTSITAFAIMLMAI